MKLSVCCFFYGRNINYFDVAKARETSVGSSFLVNVNKTGRYVSRKNQRKALEIDTFFLYKNHIVFFSNLPIKKGLEIRFKKEETS
jgi:hypothetical protein